MNPGNLEHSSSWELDYSQVNNLNIIKRLLHGMICAQEMLNQLKIYFKSHLQIIIIRVSKSFALIPHQTNIQ